MRWLNPLTFLRWAWARVRAAWDSTVERLIVIAIVASLAALWKLRHHIPSLPEGDTTVPTKIAILVPGGMAFAVVLLVALAIGIRRRKKVAEASLKLTAAYAQHGREILYALQRVLSGAIPGVDVGEFIENGILSPARDYLMEGQDDDVRLSILAPDGNDFVMPYAAGHRIESKAQFRLPIRDSFSKWAYNESRVYWSADLSTDDRFTRHPEADQERDYESIISVPIRCGEDAVAVFNAIFTPKNAFNDAELLYVRLIGAVIELVWELGDVEGQHGGAEAWPAPAAPRNPLGSAALDPN